MFYNRRKTVGLNEVIRGIARDMLVNVGSFGFV